MSPDPSKSSADNEAATTPSTNDHGALVEALAEVSAALNSTLELEEVLDLILDRISRVLPFSSGTIMMLDGDHAEIVRAKGFDPPIEGLRLVLADITNLSNVLTSGEPALINDTTNDPNWVVVPETGSIRSDMTVAIRAREEIVGAISVDSDHRDAFNLELLTRLEAFAAQAGNAIRNARLYRDSQEALREARDQKRITRILADITVEIMNQRDVDALLDYIIDRVSSFVPGAAVTVMLVKDGVSEVVRATPAEQNLIGEALVLSDTPNLLRVLETGHPHLISDTSTDPSWVLVEGVAWIRSNLNIPIKLGDRVIGFLTISSKEPNALPEALIQPMETFAGQVGIAIHNARLFDESERARTAEYEERQVAEALTEVSAALNSTLELDQVLDLILERVARVVPITAGTIMMLDGDHAEIVRARGYEDSIVGLRLDLSQTHNLAQVLRTGEPSLIDDTTTSPDWVVVPETEHIKSAMTVAIRANEKVVGAISVDSEHPGKFNTQMLERLEAFAGQAGNAIGNARLFRESQEARDRSDQLLRVILPEKIADELTNRGHVPARRYDDVAVLFADIVGFTAYCDSHDPEEVVAALAEVTGRFEEISERFGLEKMKTIGDSFMATAGLLDPLLNPDLQCVKAGLEMVAACNELRSEWSVRVGVHSGEMVAGVIGTKKFLFDVWGDTVNTASRVESHGVPDGVSVSARSWKRISHACKGRSRGRIAVKGKGEMELFVVEGLR